MQQNHLKLKEIIWEITGQCKNGCSYCGSKEVNKIPTPSHEEIMYIANGIANFPPEQIDISGGDPLLVPYETHKEIVKILKAKGVMCKILVNPKSLSSTLKSEFNSLDRKIKTLSLYHWIGISINTIQELELFNQIYNSANEYTIFNKFTIITNFNVVNLYDYQKFEDLARKHKTPWMVQFTIYPEKDNPLAIYNHENIVEKLRNKIQNSIKKGINVIVSDNATPFACGAGKNAVGILYNGSIVPCLSMRSWHKNIKEEIQGDMMDSFNCLKHVWESGFKKYRFDCFECCKDTCNNKILFDGVLKFNKEELPDLEDIEEKLKERLKNIPKFPPNMGPQVVMYAVSPGNPGGGTYVYAVFPGNENINVYAYAVFTDNDSSTTFLRPEDLQNITPVYSVVTNINIPTITSEDVSNDDENTKKKKDK